MDTMLAHSILYPEFPKGLDFLCSFYLDDVVYYKGEGRNWGAGDRDPQLWEYCCKDAVYTLRVVEKIDEELKRRNLFELYHGEQSRQHSVRDDGNEAQAQPRELSNVEGVAV